MKIEEIVKQNPEIVILDENAYIFDTIRDLNFGMYYCNQEKLEKVIENDKFISCSLITNDLNEGNFFNLSLNYDIASEKWNDIYKGFEGKKSVCHSLDCVSQYCAENKDIVVLINSDKDIDAYVHKFVGCKNVKKILVPNLKESGYYIGFSSSELRTPLIPGVEILNLKKGSCYTRIPENS